MKLTKLSAAPTLAPQAALSRRCRRMPAPANGMDAGTASQLIPGVRRTSEGGDGRMAGRDQVTVKATRVLVRWAIAVAALLGQACSTHLLEGTVVNEVGQPV